MPSGWLAKATFAGNDCANLSITEEVDPMLDNQRMSELLFRATPILSSRGLSCQSDCVYEISQKVL